MGGGGEGGKEKGEGGKIRQVRHVPGMHIFFLLVRFCFEGEVGFEGRGEKEEGEDEG